MEVTPGVAANTHSSAIKGPASGAAAATMAAGTKQGRKQVKFTFEIYSALKINFVIPVAGCFVF